MSSRGGRNGGGDVSADNGNRNDNDHGPQRKGRRHRGDRPHPYQQQRGGGGGGGRGGRGGYHPAASAGFPIDRIQPRGGRGGGGWQRGGGRRDPHPHHQQQQPSSRIPEEEKIDRTKVCPLLCRVYIQKEVHHSASAFAIRGEEPNHESIIIYTWPDASLRELTELIQLVNADSRRVDSSISFAFVYPDRTGTNVIKHVATIPSFRANSKVSFRHQQGEQHDDMKTLKLLKFETGDFLSVALIAPPPTAQSK